MVKVICGSRAKHLTAQNLIKPVIFVPGLSSRMEVSNPVDPYPLEDPIDPLPELVQSIPARHPCMGTCNIISSVSSLWSKLYNFFILIEEGQQENIDSV